MKESKYWFKRRRYGWGWTPVTWQGWSVILVYLGIVFSATFMVKDVPENTFTVEVGVFMLIVLLSTVQLIMIGIAKGPKAKWRWGKSADDDPAKDI